MRCPYCKETIQDEAITCRYCSSFLNSDTPQGMNRNGITTDEIRTFVGTNSYYYLHQFSKFNQLGVEKFAPSWNWSCFGFTWLWFLYRKMYLNALITFVIFCVPGVNFIMHIIAGVVGNYLYCKHVQDSILEIRSIHPLQSHFPVLRDAGGVHKWVITVGIIISIISVILFFMFFAAITASIQKFSGVVI